MIAEILKVIKLIENEKSTVVYVVAKVVLVKNFMVKKKMNNINIQFSDWVEPKKKAARMLVIKERKRNKICLLLVEGVILSSLKNVYIAVV